MIQSYVNEAYTDEITVDNLFGASATETEVRHERGAPNRQRKQTPEKMHSSSEEDIQSSTNSRRNDKQTEGVATGKRQPGTADDRSEPAFIKARQQPARTNSTLRSAIFYQNRFIITDPPRVTECESTVALSANRAGESRANVARRLVPSGTDMTSPHIGYGNPEIGEAAAAASGRGADDSRGARSAARNMDMDASSVTMEPPRRDYREPEIIITDTSDRASRPRRYRETTKPPPKPESIWKRISRVLQDNKMKGRADRDEILNPGNPSEFRILKRMLNIIFVTIGVALLIGVIIVIIYTAIVGDPDPPSNIGSVSNKASVNTSAALTRVERFEPPVILHPGVDV